MISAEFGLQHFLTTSFDPMGAGQISPEPPGAWYDDGMWAVVEALPFSGYRFLEWTGDLFTDYNPDSLLMDGPKSVTANFWNDPPVVTASDTSFAEDEPFHFFMRRIISQISDANHSISDLDITVERGIILDVIYDDDEEIFTVTSDVPDWYGVDTLTVKAVDPLGAEGTGPLVITVLPMPDPPSSFDLLDLTDNAVITVWPESIEFRWEQATDPDINDTLSYTLEIDTTLQFNSNWGFRIEDLTDPTATMDWPITHGDDTYYWRVQVRDSQGHTTWSNAIHTFILETGVAGGLPDEVVLQQNYPNPFNESTTIRFGIPEPSRVTVTIFDGQGRRVRRLVDGERERGYHPILWDGIDDRGGPVASGVYFVMMRSGTKKFVKRLVFLR